MKILISGSSGFIGKELKAYLGVKGYQITKLVRMRPNLLPGEIGWDLERGVIHKELLEGFDAVIHLAGENIANGIWTKNKKKRIRESRVEGTRLLCKDLIQLKNPPRVLLCASAVGYYGNCGEQKLTEKNAKGQGFLAEVCEDWEKATEPASQAGIRVINMRFGAILGTSGGVLKRLLPIFKWGLGGRLGSGSQYMSWIGVGDVLRAIDFLLNKETVRGPVNVVSPNPVTNGQFTRALGKELHRPTWFHVPSFLLKFLLGEIADEMLLTSVRAYPERLLEAGFKFNFPEIASAFHYHMKSNSTPGSAGSSSGTF